MNTTELARLFDLVSHWHRDVAPGDYCCLADENDPDGIVEFRRANGCVYMTMPRDVYDSLRAAQGISG